MKYILQHKKKSVTQSLKEKKETSTHNVSLYCKFIMAAEAVEAPSPPGRAGQEHWTNAFPTQTSPQLKAPVSSLSEVVGHLEAVFHVLSQRPQQGPAPGAQQQPAH